MGHPARRTNNKKGKNKMSEAVRIYVDMGYKEGERVVWEVHPDPRMWGIRMKEEPDESTTFLEWVETNPKPKFVLTAVGSVKKRNGRVEIVGDAE